MQMHHFMATCPLVQVINVLGDYLYVKVFLKAGNGLMPRIGMHRFELPSALVVKFKHQFRV